MKGKRLLTISSICLVLVLVALLLPTACSTKPAETIELTFGSLYPETSCQSIADAAWIEKIEKETNGRVHILPYWGATVISTKESYGEIAKGACDIGHVAAAYNPSGFPCQRAMAMFVYNINSSEALIRTYNDIYQKYPEVQAEYANVKFFTISASAPYHLMANNVVNTPEDFAGLRLKVPSAFMEPLKELGADPVNMPITEVYVSLQKGIIDGGFLPLEALKSFKFAEVIKNIAICNIGPILGTARVMNWDSWNSLPADIQKVFEDNTEWLALELVRQDEIVNQEGFDFAKQSGCEFTDMPSETLNKLYELFAVQADNKAAELDANGLPGTALYDDIQSFAEKYSK